MKAGTKIWIGIIILSFFASINISAQDVEYDDLYFNKSDRKTKKEKKYQPVTSEENVVKNDVPLTTEEFSSKNINPEYIARYKADELENESNIDEYSSDDYYVETDKRIDNNKQALLDSGDARYSNNYNRPDYYRYPNSNPYNNYRYGYGISPYYCPAGWNIGLGYTFGSFYGMPYSGYNVSMAWSTGGYGYYPYSSWYDPWYDPWYGGGGFGYPYYASRWRVGFGVGYGYYNSFYNPYYYYPSYVVIGEGSNNFHYGRRDSRTTTSITSRNYNNTRLTSTSADKNIKIEDSNNSVNSRTRDYSKLQNEYYRSNSRSVNSSSSIDRSSYTNRTSINRNSSNDRIISSTSDSRVSNNSTYTSRPSRSNTYTQSSNSGRTSTYSTPSRSSSSSYTPSRSGSYNSNSYSRPSSGSKSSSSYSSGSSGSRSSSYTPSRSSSSSSSSRSSSSSSSTPSRSSSSSSSSGRR